MTLIPALLAAWIAAFDEASDSAKRQIAARLQPYLADRPETLLNSREKAEQLGLNPETLVKMARAGRVPGATQAGREWRFPSGHVEIKSVRGGALLPAGAGRARRTSAREDSTAAAIGGARKCAMSSPEKRRGHASAPAQLALGIDEEPIIRRYGGALR